MQCCSPSESSSTVDICEPTVPLPFNFTDARENAQDLELQGGLAQVMQRCIKQFDDWILSFLGLVRIS